MYVYIYIYIVYVYIYIYREREMYICVGPLGKSARETQGPGLDRGFCRRLAWTRLASKKCFVSQTPLHLSNTYVYVYMYVYICIYIHM